MRRIMKFLGRLYPSAWRNRYGAEFEALLEDHTPRVQDLFDVLSAALKMRVPLQSLLRIVIPCGLAGSLVALVISSSTPPRYVSETVMQVRSRLDSRICEDQSDLPMELRGPSQGVCDVPAQSVDKSVRDLIRPAFDRNFLASLIEEKNLYSRERASLPLDQVVDKMQASIHLTPVKGSRVDSSARVYDIRFEYSDPQVAQQINGILVSHAINTTLRSMLAARSESGTAPGLKYAQTFRIENPASLPQLPTGLSRAEQSAVGLLAGLLGGFILALAIGSRYDATVTTG
jgi:hypothetical protein